MRCRTTIAQCVAEKSIAQVRLYYWNPDDLLEAGPISRPILFPIFGPKVQTRFFSRPSGLQLYWQDGAGTEPALETNSVGTVPCPSFPFFCFLEKCKEHQQKARIFLYPAEPLKSLEKKGKTLKKQGNPCRAKKKKKQGIPKKQRKGRTGFFFRSRNRNRNRWNSNRSIRQP